MAPATGTREATWADKEVKLKVQMRHGVTLSGGTLPDRSSPSHQPQKEQPKGIEIHNMMAKPSYRACVGFNEGTCTDATPHPKELHVWSYCMVVVSQLCVHLEHFCLGKLADLAKNGVRGF